MKIERMQAAPAWKCSLCGADTGGEAISFKAVPYILGVTDKPASLDRTVDFNIGECPDCGLVQHDHEISGEMYSEIHSHAVGKIWADHFHAFTGFIGEALPAGARLLEIGPSSTPMARGLNSASAGMQSATFVDFMAEPPFPLRPGETYHSGYFPHAELRGQRFDAVIASHVLEHAPRLGDFFENLVDCVSDSGSIYLSIPDFKAWIGRTYWNAFSLEHVTYPVQRQMSWLASKFKLGLRRANFSDHSAFFEFSARLPASAIDADASLWERSALPWQAQVNAQIVAFEAALGVGESAVYLTGASHLSQYLIACSALVNRRCTGVLDNAPAKHGKRLYGTNAQVHSFDELIGRGPVAVVVPPSPYQQEIVRQIETLNPEARVIAG